MTSEKTLLILTARSPESFSPSGERVRFIALAGGSLFEKVIALALKDFKEYANSSRCESKVQLRTINFSRAMPYPILEFFDPVRFFVFVIHALVESRRIKPLFVIASMPPLEVGLSAWVLSKLTHAKLVIDLRDDWESAVRIQLRQFFPVTLFNVLSAIANQVYSSSLIIFVATQTIIETLKKRGVTAPTLLVPNGADTGVFKPETNSARIKTRPNYALPVDRIVTIYCGSGDNPYYRLDLVLSSITLLPKDTLERFFFVFYVPNGHRYLNELKQKYGIPDDYVEVRNPLPRGRLAKVLSACDIGLVPFDAKSYLLCARSTKIYEYLSSGLYVVSTGPQRGELDSFFSVNPYLGLFTPPSASNIAHALVQVAERTEDLMSDGSRKLRYGFIRKNYDRQDRMRDALNRLFAMARV